jgi:hypothetical protein
MLLSLEACLMAAVVIMMVFLAQTLMAAKGEYQRHSAKVRQFVTKWRIFDFATAECANLLKRQLKAAKRVLFSCRIQHGFDKLRSFLAPGTRC